MSAVALILVLLLIIISVVIFSIRHCRLKRQRKEQLYHMEVILGDEEQANLLDDASNWPRNSSAKNADCSAQDASVRYRVHKSAHACHSLESGEPSAVQASSSVSASESDLPGCATDVSLHHVAEGNNLANDDNDEENSYEITVVPRAGRKLAEAFVAANT